MTTSVISKLLCFFWIKPKSFCEEAKDKGPLIFYLLTLDFSTVLHRRGSCDTLNQSLEQQQTSRVTPAPWGETDSNAPCAETACLSWPSITQAEDALSTGALQSLFCHTRHDVTSVAQSHTACSWERPGLQGLQQQCW